MHESNPERISPELTSEREKKLDLAVGFLRGCDSVDGLFQKIDLATKEGNLDTVMLDEYNLTVCKVADSVQAISEEAKARMVDIVMAPTFDKESDVTGEGSWHSMKKKLQAAGVVVLDDGIEEEVVRDSVGFYFHRDGSVFAFPKSWEHPIHAIPGTKVAVTICGEIGRIKPTDLDDATFDVLYNPSREGDDPYLRYRMAGLSNGELSEDELEALLMKDGYYEGLRPETDEEKARRSAKLNPEDREFLEQNPVPDVSPAEYEERRREYREKVRAIVEGEKNALSMYVKDIASKLAEKRIAVVRSDGMTTSGVLNPMPGLWVGEIKEGDDYTSMQVSLDGK